MKMGLPKLLKILGCLGYWLCGLLLSFSVYAQEPFLRTHELGEPLNQANINCIYQSDLQKLWLGTNMGLVFYDGLTGQLYSTTDNSRVNITALAENSNGELMIGSAQGILYGLDENLKQIFAVPGASLPGKITAINASADHGLLIASYHNGIYQYKEGTLLAISSAMDSELGDIYDMRCTGQTLWVGADRGLQSLEYAASKEGWQINKKATAGVPGDIARIVITDEKGGVWTGTYGGMLSWRSEDAESWTNFSIPNGGVVQAISHVHDEEVWVATEDNGLWMLNPGLKKWTRVKEGRANCKALHFDAEGNLWMATDKGGLQSSNRFFDFVSLGIKDAQSVLHTAEGIWVGTKHGLYFWNESNGRISLAPGALRNSNVISLYQDNFDNIWAGTFGKGVQLFQPKTKRQRHLDLADGLTNGNILDIDGYDNKVWLATLGGVMEIALDVNPFDQPKLQFNNYNQDSDVGTNFIYCVYPDSKGRVWFGTDGRGLSVLENNNISTIAEYMDVASGDNYVFNTVYSIAEDDAGKIWFSTPANEVFSYDGGQISKLSRKAAMQSKSINALVSDPQGMILILHDQGIDQLNPLTNRLIYFDDYVGLKDFQCNLNAYDIGKDNKLWMASADYLVRYQPLTSIENSLPQTVITAVSASNDPVAWKSQHEFPHDKNQFVIRYAGLWYTNPGSLEYRYRLSNYDQDWRNTKDVVATYPALPPGEYTFEVMSSGNSSFSNEPIANYSFEIAKPYWKTWWFIALMALLAGFVLYSYVRIRDQRVRNLESLKKEKVESQLETLKTQINPHFLFNNFNTLISIIEVDPKIAVEYVENLSDFYRSILKYREQSKIALSEELQTVENYAFILRKRFGDNFSLDVNVENEDVQVIPMALQRLVENALKHNEVSKSKPLRIQIKQLGNEIVVSNNINPKLQKPKSTGFGLSSLKSEYELISQRQVEVAIDDSTFKVSLPALK